MVTKKVYKKTPGGKTVMRTKSKLPSKSRCGSCGSMLHGMVRGTNTQRKKMSKSSKRPERPYGGILCSKCARQIQKQKAREE